MKRTLFLAFFIVTAIGASYASAQTSILKADDAFRLSVDRSENDQVALHWKIAPGYYLYRDHIRAGDTSSQKSINLILPAGVTKLDPTFGSTVIYYSNLSTSFPASAIAQIKLQYQGCKENSICYPPITKFIDLKTLSVSDTASIISSEAIRPAPAEATASGFHLAEDTDSGLVSSLLHSGGPIWVIASFFVFGLFLAFTPCVLPMYPILAATLARSGEQLSALRGVALSSAYVVAMATAFGMLGIAAAWSGENLQIVLQSPYAVIATAGLFAVLAMSMFGFFEIQLPSRWVNKISSVQESRTGSFGSTVLLGFTSALIVGPCVTAPLAAALLYIAQTGNARLGAAALFSLGLGQGLPLVLLGVLGGRILPRAGGWMVYVKYTFGFVFLAAAIWMASRILPPHISLALCAIALITMSVFLGVFENFAYDAPRFRLQKAAGIVVLLYGAILFVGASSGATDPLRPLQSIFVTTRRAEAENISFTKASSTTDLQEQLRLARDDDKPTLVYVTAEWCVSCKTIDREVLDSPDVKAALHDYHRIKVDVTNLSAANSALMRDIHVIGPPTMIFFDKSANEIPATRLVGEISTQSLLASSRGGEQ